METSEEPTAFQRLAVIAQSHGGCFSRREATTAGLSGDRVTRAVQRGEFVRLHPGVYTWSGTPITPLTRQWGAIVAAGTDADGTGRLVALSHRAAASRIGTAVFDAEQLVEITIAGEGRPRLSEVTLHRANDLKATAITPRYGPPTTTAARTLLDLSVTKPLLAGKVMEEWLAARKVTISALRGAIGDHRRHGRAGPNALAELLEGRTLGDLVPDSTLEGEFGEILTRYGVPLPVHHFVVASDGTVIAELDWSYPGSMVALEVNGYGVHLQSRHRWEHDLDRHNELTKLGWSILYYSRRMILRTPRKIALEVDAHRLARAGIGLAA